MILMKILSENSTREKKTATREKKSKFSPWNEIFCPWKNIKRVPVKKKSGREKNWNKCAWKGISTREKTRKNVKNGFHGHFLFSRGKKNTAHR